MESRRNHAVGWQIRQHRENVAQLSPEDWAHEINRKAATAGRPLGMSGRTIRRIEAQGIIPTIRIQGALANELGKQPWELWGSRERVAA